MSGQDEPLQSLNRTNKQTHFRIKFSQDKFGEENATQIEFYCVEIERIFALFWVE